MEFSEFKDGIHYKWQHSLIKLCWWGSAIVFLFEIVVFLAFLKTDFLTTSIPYYLFIRVITPSGINFITAAVCTYIVKSNRFTVSQKNYAASYAIFTLGSVVAICHNYYKFLLVANGLPIMICAIFADKKILRRLLYLSIGVFIASVVVMCFDDVRLNIVDLSTTVLCAFMFLFIVYHIAKVMVDYQAEQINFIFNSSTRQTELIHELKIEPLTKLYNRIALSGAMPSFVRKYNSGFYVPHLALIDLDNFKQINDRYGHAAGDAVLVKLAEIIKNNMNGIRRAFRYGGEEFVLLFDIEDLPEVLRVLESIRKDLSEVSFDFAPEERFTLSAGVSVIQKGWDDTTWFNAADAAMYKAKESGRNRIEVAD